MDGARRVRRRRARARSRRPGTAAGEAPYAVAAVGRQAGAGRLARGAAPRRPPSACGAPMTPLRRLQFAARFVAGSLAGALFVPLGAALHARQRAAGAPRDVTAGAASAARPPRPRRRRALWRFTRPHTIIGTTLSILGLYVLVAEAAARAAALATSRARCSRAGA